MAQQLDAWPEDKVVWRGRQRLYDWDSWLNGEVWKLTEGKDFKCTVNGFRAGAFSVCRRRGLKIRTAVVAGSNPTEVVIQAFKKPSRNGKKK